MQAGRSRLIRQRKRTDYCQLHLSSPFYRGQGPRLAYPALDNPRRNRIIPMNEMALLLGQRRPAFWVICCLILLVAEGFASADATKGHENKRSLRSPFGNLRAPMLLDFHCCFWARLRTRFICISHSAFLIANFPLLPPVPLHRKKQTWYDNQTNRQGRISGWTRRAGSSC